MKKTFSKTYGITQEMIEEKYEEFLQKLIDDNFVNYNEPFKLYEMKYFSLDVFDYIQLELKITQGMIEDIGFRYAKDGTIIKETVFKNDCRWITKYLCDKGTLQRMKYGIYIIERKNDRQ